MKYLVLLLILSGCATSDYRRGCYDALYRVNYYTVPNLQKIDLCVDLENEQERRDTYGSHGLLEKYR